MLQKVRYLQTMCQKISFIIQIILLIHLHFYSILFLMMELVHCLRKTHNCALYFREVIITVNVDYAVYIHVDWTVTNGLTQRNGSIQRGSLVTAMQVRIPDPRILTYPT